MVSVGSASVSLVPDATGFQVKTDALLRSIKAKVDLVLKDAGIREQIDAVARDHTATINANLDDGAARAQLDALTKARSVTINANADTGAAEAKMAALGNSAGGASSQIGMVVAAVAGLGPALVPIAAAGAAAFAGIGSGAIAAAGGIGVLALGLSGVVSAVSAVVKAQDSSAASAAQNAAQQVAAAQRIQSAQTALKSAEASLANTRATAADAARRSAEQVVQAQQGIQVATQQAQQNIAQAAERAAAAQRSVVQAQQAVRDATQQAAQAVQTAIDREASAERSLQSALQQETDAQTALSAARKQAKQDLVDLTNSVADGALAQRQAAIDVENTKNALTALGPTQVQIEQATARAAAAQDRYTKLLANPAATDAQKATAQAALDAAKAQQQALEQAVGGTSLQRQQAQLDYDQAVQHQKELATNQSRLIQQQKDAQKAGVSGAPGVVNAQQNLDQAKQNVADAQKAVIDAQNAITQARVTGDQQIARAEQSLADAQRTAADAQKAVVQARVDGARQIQQAEQSLADAQAAQTSQQRQSAFSISQAQQQVINSQRSLQDAYAKTGTTASTSSTQAQEALAKLTPEGRRLTDFITGTLIPGFREFGRIAQAPIAAGLLSGLQAMAPLMPTLTGLTTVLAKAMGDLFDQAGKALGSPFWINFFRIITSIAAPTISGLGRIIGNVFTGMAGILEEFAPVGQRILDWSVNLSKRFSDFGTGKTGGLQRFFAYVQQVGPLVVATLGSLFGAAGHIVTALAPFGTTVLGWIKGFADWISRIPAGVLRNVVVYAVEAFVAFKAWTALSGIIGGVVTTIAELANPVGLVVAAIGLLAAGMVLLYQNSKPFRTFINSALVPALKDVWSWVKQHVIPALQDLWGYIQRNIVPVLIYLGRNVLAGARDAFDQVRRAIQQNQPELQQLWTGFKILVDFIVKYILPLFGPVLKAVFSSFGTQISDTIRIIGFLVDAFDWIVKAGTGTGRQLRSIFGTVFSDLRRIFRTGVDDIQKIWHGVEAVAKAPVSFIINTVLDKGLIPAYNWVAGVLPGLKKINPVHVAGFASGTSNVLPGYTPGRDVHRFYSPTAGVIDLSGGEGIARPELVSAVGAARWDAANAAAASGNVAQGMRYLGGFAAGTGNLRLLGGGGSGRVWPTNTHVLSPTYPGHSGVDIAAGMGAPIYAAAPGTISYTGWNHGYGQAIFEKILGSALSIVYGHTSKLLTKPGAHVTAGQLIGLVGATGHATGPHLHFEINSPGPFGNAADRANSLAWLNGATVSGGGGTVGSSGGGILDWLSGLTSRFSGPLGKLRSLGSSPWAQLVAGIPKSIASQMISSAKNFASGVLGDITGALSKGANQTRGLALLTAAGFNPVTQWSALNQLWTRESGWRANATNPSSGAYGIPQALPASKMASAGSDWRTNPSTQIKWGLQYIKDVYGSPAAAWAHELSQGWYDNGGWLQPGTTLVHNDTGKPEPVLNPSQWSAFEAMANRPGITFAPNITGNDIKDEQALAQAVMTRFSDAMTMAGMTMGVT